MTTLRNPTRILAGCLVGLLLFGTSEAKADPITDFDGVIGQFTITNTGPGQATISVTPGTSGLTALNGNALNFAQVIPTTISDFNLSGGSVVGNVTKIVGPGGVDVTTVGNPAVTGIAIFDLNNFTNVNIQDTNITIEGTEDVVGSNSSLDLTQFGLGGSFTFTFNQQGGGFLAILSGSPGDSLTGSGSFSQTGLGEGPGPLPGIPEPASILMWSLIAVTGLGGYFYTRRRGAGAKLAA